MASIIVKYTINIKIINYLLSCYNVSITLVKGVENMLEFLFGNKNSNQENKSIKINHIYSALKKAYPADKISDDRKKELSDLIKKYGYLPYPYIKALEELSPEEILFGLEIK